MTFLLECGFQHQYRHCRAFQWLADPIIDVWFLSWTYQLHVPRNQVIGFGHQRLGPPLQRQQLQMRLCRRRGIKSQSLANCNPWDVKLMDEDSAWPAGLIGQIYPCPKASGAGLLMQLWLNQSAHKSIASNGDWQLWQLWMGLAPHQVFCGHFSPNLPSGSCPLRAAPT